MNEKEMICAKTPTCLLINLTWFTLKMKEPFDF